MSFLNGIFLWGLLAAGLPLLVHLFYRRRKTMVDFSTVQFFRPQQRFLSHRRRLRELLLLALRVLALVLLALALARPLLRSMPHVLEARTDVVLVLDDTLSMDRRGATGERAFETARTRALALLATLREGDGAALVHVSGRQGTDLERSHQALANQLRSSRVTAAGGSYANALRQASGILSRSASPNREVYLFTDLQAGQLPEQALEPAGDDQRLFLVETSGTTENLGLRDLHLTRKPKIVGQPWRLPATVHNYGSRARSAEVVLEVNGSVVERRPVELPAGEAREVVFTQVPSAAGFVAGQVSIEDPDMTLDNRLHFACEVAEHLPVLLLESDIYSKAQPHLFLQLALDPPGGGHLNGFRLDRRYVQEISPTLLRDYAIVVLANPDPLPTVPARTLADYVRSGGTVIAFAGPKILPDTYAELPVEKLRELQGPREDFDHRGLRFAGPLAGLNEMLDLDLLTWRSRCPLAPGADAAIWARAADEPAIVAERLGDGQWIATSFSARRDFSNWPELKSFPITMIHLLSHAGHGTHQVPVWPCGQPLRLAAEAENVTVTRPDGSVLELAASEGTALLEDTWQPALLRLAEARDRAVVLQPVAAESDLTRVGPEAAVKRLWDGPSRILDPRADLAEQVRGLREGNDLAGPALLAMFVLLVAEGALGSGYVLTGRA